MSLREQAACKHACTGVTLCLQLCFALQLQVLELISWHILWMRTATFPLIKIPWVPWGTPTPAMALRQAREVAGDLAEEFAEGEWHEDEKVYERFHDVSRQVVQDVVQSGLICYVCWKRVPAENSSPEAWKWWCWIPVPLFIFMSGIPGLREWLQWEVCLSRKQLLWMEEFLAEYKIHHFYVIKVLKIQAAAFLHMKKLSRVIFYQQLEDCCRVSDGHDQRHEAPRLSRRGQQNKANAQALGLIHE